MLYACTLEAKLISQQMEADDKTEKVEQLKDEVEEVVSLFFIR
jgi:hypothetical protein